MAVNEGKRQLDERNILSVLQFTTRILLPKYPYSVFPILTTLYIAHQNRAKRQRLQLRTLPADIHSKFIPEVVKRSYPGNINSCVLVSFNVLESLEISTCTWQKLCKANHKEIADGQVETKGYLVYVVAVPDISDSTAFVTNVMYHNINEALLLDCKIGFVNFEASTIICKNKSLTFIPQIASKAVVSLMNAATISNDIVDVILTHYFQNIRYLCHGDIFEVDVPYHAPDVYFSNYEIKFLYFKILEITGPDYEDVDWKDTTYGFYIIKDLTSLVRVADQHGYLPRREHLSVAVDEHLTTRNYKSLLLNICPFGLDSQCKQLIMCIKPFLKTKVRKDALLRPLILLNGPRGAGKCKICNCSAQMLGMNIWMVDSLEQQGSTPGFTEGRMKFIFGKAIQYAPCIVVLKNIEALCKNGTESRVISSFADEIDKLMQELKTKQYPVVVVATINTKTETSEPLLPPALGRLFLYTVHLSSPSESDRKVMLDWILKKNGIKVDSDFSLSHIAARSSGFLYADLKALVSQALKVKYKQLRNVAEGQKNVQMCLSKETFEEALDIMHAAYSDAIGAPKIPKVTWSDVGGLENLKEEIMRTVMMPLQYPELAASGLRRSGILLYGPPGTGKTLLAKAVATECNLNFLSVKGPELLNMYVGQSEENVREVFGRARAASPCIIFFDELDSLAPNRGRSGDSGGVMDRVVSQLLAEMDGLQKSAHLFVIAATNRPDLIDPALLRPGRFDKLLYVGMCEDNQSKLNVLATLTRRFNLHKNVNLEELTSQFPDVLTGADIYSLCSSAWLSAVRTRIYHLEKYGNDNAGEPVEVEKKDFEKALENFTPSVSTDDHLYFKQLQNQITRR